MIDELIIRQKYLIALKSQGYFSKRHFLKNAKLKKKQINLKIQQIMVNNQNNILLYNALENLAYWLLNTNNYLYTLSPPPQPTIQIIRKDFNLLAEIALSKNEIPVPCLLNFRLVFELLYLVAPTKGLNAGTEFIRNFIALANKCKLPIVLYCESKLVPYYKKFQFQKVFEQIRKNKKEILMVYFPEI